MHSRRFIKALWYAAGVHRTQVRKGTPVPYIAHPLAVTSLALEYGASEVEAIAALLHDAIEDCGGERIRRRIIALFGLEIASIVVHCSEPDKGEKSWQDRKDAAIAHYRVKPASAQLVSACDKLHNARAILRDYRIHGESLWDRFDGAGENGHSPRERTLWYYRTLAATLGEVVASPNADPRLGPLVDEFRRVVEELDREAAERQARG